MVGVVLGVGGPLSRLRWLWTGLCAGGMSGLRAGSLREKSETALCTAGERGAVVGRAPGSSSHHPLPPMTNPSLETPGHCQSHPGEITQAFRMDSCQNTKPNQDTNNNNLS